MLSGGRGDDQLAGLGGNDRLDDEDGMVNLLRGGDGDDSIFVGLLSKATVHGDAGNDRLSTLATGSRRGRLFGGAGKDVLQSTGGKTSDYGSRLDGGPGPDVLTGGKTKDDLLGGPGDDLVYGGAGSDRHCEERCPGGDTTYVADGDDRFFGGEGADFAYLGKGRDRAEGGDGDDRLYGGSDRDSLLGQKGSDDLFGGSGFDYCLGGTSNDAISQCEGDSDS